MILNRLIDFYHCRTNLKPHSVEGVWAAIMQTSQKPLLDALEIGHVESLQHILSQNFILNGIDGLVLEKWTTPYGLESLNSLARRLGLLNAYNPEQPSPTQNFTQTNTTLLQREIEALTGTLNIPSCFGRDPNPDKEASITALWTLGQCWTIKMLLPTFPQSALEIGAGIGLFGYFAKRFGLKQYVIVDIPTTAVTCAYSLTTMLGEDAVWLYGEPENPNAFARIYPADAKELIVSKHDLVFNSNSFPEIPTDIQDEYVQLIPTWLKDDGILYSCNHESDVVNQRSLKDAIADDPRYRRMYRAPFMVRAGYIEEMYKLTL